MEPTKEEVSWFQQFMELLKAKDRLMRALGRVNKDRKYTKKGYEKHFVRKTSSPIDASIEKLKDPNLPDNLKVRRALLDKVTAGELTREEMLAELDTLKKGVG